MYIVGYRYIEAPISVVSYMTTSVGTTQDGHIYLYLFLKRPSGGLGRRWTIRFLSCLLTETNRANLYPGPNGSCLSRIGFHLPPSVFRELLEAKTFKQA